MKAGTIQAKREPAVKEVHVVWMTTGLGCDGDSVSITAASQPSLLERKHCQTLATRKLVWK